MKTGDRDRISENKLNGTPLNADAENTNFPPATHVQIHPGSLPWS